ncbi:hypothetical protein [Rhizobium sp. BK176]|uniref:hypothetical protein n=1 Tax=Rhizobium sp. BK176 TaxID=2587071 RepID=UPI002167217E|nr:hypothetical protein [Rhizobium sp. BK176]MCS4089644.1 hypothetical protein [Rhizobium sp. BK176]
MKAHFYPFTGQVTPVPLDFLVCLGVPTAVVDAAQLLFSAIVFETETDAPDSNCADRVEGGIRD